MPYIAPTPAIMRQPVTFANLRNTTQSLNFFFYSHQHLSDWSQNIYGIFVIRFKKPRIQIIILLLIYIIYTTIYYWYLLLAMYSFSRFRQLYFSTKSSTLLNVYLLKYKFKDLIKSTLNSRKFEVRQIPGTVHAKYDMFTVQGHVPSNGKEGVFFLT